MNFTMFEVLVEEKWASYNMECWWKRNGFHNIWNIDRRKVDFVEYKLSMKEK